MNHKKYVAIIAPSTGKKHSLTKKKDLSKISEEEFEILLGIAEDKILKLDSVFNKTLLNYFNGKVVQNSKITFRVFDNVIEYIFDIKPKRLKDRIKIVNPESWWDIPDENFIARNHKAIYPIKGQDKILDIFEFIDIIFKETKCLITKYIGQSNEKKAEIIINRKNINEFIRDIDLVLMIFYANPRINSATALNSTNLENLKTTLAKMHFRYNIIKEDVKYISNPDGNSFEKNHYFVAYILIFHLESDRFKIHITIDYKNKYTSAINLYKWNDISGWVVIDNLKFDYEWIPETKLIPFDKNTIYKNGEIDIYLIEALKYLHRFLNIKWVTGNFQSIDVFK